MSVRDKSYRLFEYISQVFAIDLPVARDVRQSGYELWWVADIAPSQQCKVKEFYEGTPAPADESAESVSEDTWLTVSKRTYDTPPELPYLLKDWIDVPLNPTKEPITRASRVRDERFERDHRRSKAFAEYFVQWQEWKKVKSISRPQLPAILEGWIDKTKPDTLPPEPLRIRQTEEKFRDDPKRVKEFKSYVEGSWKTWSDTVKPFYYANVLYDQLFSLYQRLSVEGDRLEIVWGHLLLSWDHSRGNTVYYPLLVTPVNLTFDPARRIMTLSPSQIPTKLSLDCLANLDFALQGDLVKLAHEINSSALEPWNHSFTRATTNSVTGYLSKEPLEKTNCYSESTTSKPPIYSYPTVHNAPIIFVHERTRRLWIEDARKVAEAVYRGDSIPLFISSLVANEAEYIDIRQCACADAEHWDDDDGENYLPLLYNDQQKDIVDNLKRHFGVLVQGPPGTGKSHTIANIVSSLLARGMKVLVTSQTENALRVLRDYIPQEIRSLCVSHLGSDVDSKRQMGEALTAIGNHMSERTGAPKDAAIKSIKQELRDLREEQALLRNQIKGWVALDRETLHIDGTDVTAQQAAKECSDNENAHSWFPDRFSPESEPPLSDQELTELCTLMRDITLQDKSSFDMHLPDSKKLLSPESLALRLDQVDGLAQSMSKAQPHLLMWTERLASATKEQLNEGISLVQSAVEELSQLEAPWQKKVLDLMVSELAQESYWKGFHDRCNTLRSSAWQDYEKIRDYEIRVDGLPVDFDAMAALEEMEDALIRGIEPESLLGRLRLSKRCKLLYKSVTVNGQPLKTIERVGVIRAHFSYSNRISRVESVWSKTISNVEGPQLQLSCPMPLEEIDVKCRLIVAPIRWMNKHFLRLKESLHALGYRGAVFHTQQALEECTVVLQSQVTELQRRTVVDDLIKYEDFLKHESERLKAHPLWHELATSAQSKDMQQYGAAFTELRRLEDLRDKVMRIRELAAKLRAVAPLWLDSLEQKCTREGPNALQADWRLAWRWRRLHRWLDHLHSRESADALQTRLERLLRREREKIVDLVKERTWQRQIRTVQDHQYRALVSWADAMRRYGKTGGKFPERWLKAAAKAMADAVGAVPAWIMPLHRVVQSFPAEPAVFDVVIIDEASQCDMRALPVLFRGKKVLVVGDPEQISPAQVGVDRGKVYALNSQYLSDIPYADTTFLIENSLYDITRAVPRVNQIMLTEHFRCVPQIIEFNNHLCPSYAGRLEPLRQPHPADRLDPPIVTIPIDSGYKDNNDVNKPEAEALVEKLLECCRDERYAIGGKNGRKRTMGVISLLGEKQAKYISDLIAQHLDETEREQRRIICGDAYAFQGDERDVMFLSLVVASNSQFASLTKDSDRQRFNVATSRARDQVFLFHSIGIQDIKSQSCVRYQLLKWYLDPLSAPIEGGIEILRKIAESDFEIEVGEKIIRRGYTVIPQYKPFSNDRRYRIDLVVQGENNRIAVECDGDRWHGPDKWEYDQRREAQLRRAGWKFWRISGSAYYRNKDESLNGLWEFLEAEGISPWSATDAEGSGGKKGEPPV